MQRDNTKQNLTNEAQLGDEALEELSGGTLHISPVSLGPDQIPELDRRNSDEPKEGGATYTW